MKHANGKGGALYCAVLTILLFSLALFLGCVGEAGNEAAGNDVKLQSEGKDKVTPAQEPTGREDDIPEGFTTDRYFSPGLVMVYLNRENGWAKRQYTPEDFPEFAVEEVRELSEVVWNRVLEQIELDKAGSSVMLINLDIFERIIYLTLAEKNRESVINAINSLVKRADVEKAQPVYTDAPQEPGFFPNLDAETERQIKIDFRNTMVSPHFGFVTVDDLYILDYFGNYNGNEALVMLKPTGAGSGLYLWFTVAGFRFDWTYPGFVLCVWKQGDNPENGRCYELDEAYDLGLLAVDDIRSIHEQLQGRDYMREYRDLWDFFRNKTYTQGDE